MIELVQYLYHLLDISRTANMGDFWGFVSLNFIALACLFKFFSSPPRPEEEEKEVEEVTHTEELSWRERLGRGLSRSRREVWQKLGNAFSGEVDGESLEEVEELLYLADLGPEVVEELMGQLKKRIGSEALSKEDFKDFLFQFLRQKMAPIQDRVETALHRFDPSQKKQTRVVMVAGVNGAGKTTTIGKLAVRLSSEGANVVVGACDTFRAAAVNQLQVWCERAGAVMVRGKEGAAPSGVGHEALQRAIQSSADYCILDTAGRLHTKVDLMQELTKCKKVLKKLLPSAPHEVLLVVDAITGQNALRQAREFNSALGLTGLVLTKCDGSSKGGSVVGMVQNLQCPILFVGVGEKVGDLNSFDLDEYLEALLVDKP